MKISQEPKAESVPPEAVLSESERGRQLLALCLSVEAADCVRALGRTLLAKETAHALLVYLGQRLKNVRTTVDDPLERERVRERWFAALVEEDDQRLRFMNIVDPNAELAALRECLSAQRSFAARALENLRNAASRWVLPEQWRSRPASTSSDPVAAEAHRLLCGARRPSTGVVVVQLVHCLEVIRRAREWDKSSMGELPVTDAVGRQLAALQAGDENEQVLQELVARLQSQLRDLGFCS